MLRGASHPLSSSATRVTEAIRFDHTRSAALRAMGHGNWVLYRSTTLGSLLFSRTLDSGSEQVACGSLRPVDGHGVATPECAPRARVLGRHRSYMSRALNGRLACPPSSAARPCAHSSTPKGHSNRRRALTFSPRVVESWRRVTWPCRRPYGFLFERSVLQASVGASASVSDTPLSMIGRVRRGS